jgi:histidinol-phosphatase (PHP family)
MTSDGIDGTDWDHIHELAVDIVEAAGFRPGADRYDFWRR